MGFSVEKRNGCYGNIASKEEEEQEANQDYCKAMKLAASSVLPMVMQTAIELDLFRIIAGAGQASASEIASRLATNNPAASAMLDRILYFLTAHSILTCTVLDDADDHDGGHRRERLYGLTQVSKYFVPDKHGFSLSPFLTLIQDKVMMDSWCELKNSTMEGGIPFIRAHGVHPFEYSAKNPKFNEAFNKGMLNHTIMVTNKIVESYKGLENIKEMVDVGGGVGTTLGIITSNYPNIKAINYDLPHVIQHAMPYPGVEYVGGDMFESVPNGEAMFMKWILHDWSDEECLKLLKNCYKSLPKDGMVIVVEGLLPEIPEKSASVQALCDADLVMMTQIPGGRERTKQEFLDLAMASGFSGIRFNCRVYNYWIMEFFK